MKSCDALCDLLKKSPVVTAVCEEVLAIPYPDPVFRGFQGGCSDGKRYFYQVLMHYELSDRTKDYSCIAKVDLLTHEVQYSGVLRLEHANDVTYHPGRHELIVVHNKPHANRITFVDPDTLTVTGTRDVDFPIYALEYNEKRDCYLAGLSGTREFRFLDADFRPTEDRTHRTTVESDRCTKQGICADDALLYFILWDGRHKAEPDFQNRVTLYDWSGEYRGVLNFDVGPNEPECISIVDGEILAVCVKDGLPMIYRFRVA
ncbi:MAG: hypothetical protein J6B77_05510 [Clostridia bacterium]|nr:hypothetical protein [Clostridia bacterium]